MQKYPVHRCRTVVAAGIVLFMLFLLSCATEYPLNIKRDTIDTPEERSVNLAHSKASPLFLILAFSGGGTRAAALSYGTLEALRSVELTGRIAETTNGSRQRTMLDEVSIIVAVSGGSFTAAYYGLRGDNIFKDYRE
ncbi:MAG TPA: patatin-like phospholipase family protein, partial [Candidatus Cloacimonadota bacterium]|nr:patatin-like phospholipase family protein [Candidatus Cloacimonadota bacterium]